MIERAIIAFMVGSFFMCLATIVVGSLRNRSRDQHEADGKLAAERPSRGGINEFHSSSSDIPGAK